MLYGNSQHGKQLPSGKYVGGINTTTLQRLLGWITEHYEPAENTVVDDNLPVHKELVNITDVVDIGF
jgi:hypothetical protein